MKIAKEEYVPIPVRLFNVFKIHGFALCKGGSALSNVQKTGDDRSLPIRPVVSIKFLAGHYTFTKERAG